MTRAIAVAVTLLAMASTAHALPQQTKVAVPLKSDYRYQQVAQGAGPGFESVSFDDSAWSVGTAGFGSIPGQCSWNTPAFVSTLWAADTDILLRKRIVLPASASRLRVLGTVDNDATVYVNGRQVGLTEAGFCRAGTLDVTAPDDALADGENVLAIRGHDYGASTYIDQTVTYDVPVYSVCVLTDAARAVKAGATIPLKLRLCDADGTNVSSPDVVVHATGLRKLAAASAAAVEDAGNANPGDDFRYSADLGGYIFNKSTKALSAGTWRLSFAVDGDSQDSYSLDFSVR